LTLLNGWLMPDAEKRRARLRRFFGIELRHIYGHVWVTSDMSGAALSMSPGRWRTPLRATLLEARAFAAHLGRAAWLGAAIEGRHGRECASRISAMSGCCRRRRGRAWAER
jgi:hypothetical protein